MADRTNERLGASFSLPDRVTVRQQLGYYSEAGLARGAELWLRLWMGARNIVADWKCEIFPDPLADLDDITDPRVTEIVIWAALETKTYMDALDTVPKN